MQEQNEKKAHGGRREGAGRKKTSAKYYYFSALPKVHEILQQVEGSKSAFINECILKACGVKEDKD